MTTQDERHDARTALDLDRLRAVLHGHAQEQRERVEALTSLEPDDGGLNPLERRRAVEVAETVLSDVQQALDRMAEGSYGFCTRCLDPLPVERLWVIPQARHCVQCASL